MLTKRLPIVGYSHLAVAAIDDPHIAKRLVLALESAGFKFQKSTLVPPNGADSTAIIGAITTAYQRAANF